MGRIGTALASSTFNRLKTDGLKISELITKGPKSLTAMCIIGGVLTALNGFFGMMNLLSPFDILASAYNFVFGLLFIFLEVHEKIGYLGFVYQKIEYWMRVLTTLTGRSMFYLYVGSLFLSKMTFFSMVLGAYMCACGIFSFVIGKRAVAKLNEPQFELQDMEQGQRAEFVKGKFNEFDHDASGFIDVKEFPSLLEGLGQQLTEAELEMALKILDTNGNGTIEFSEFQRWLNGRNLEFV